MTLPERVLAELALAEQLNAAGQETLAGLVQWHRREAKPAWWEVYRLKDLDAEELIDDASALGGLSGPVQAGEVARSRLWRYEFPPQDCKLEVGKTALCTETQESGGEVHALDPVQGWVVLKRAKTKDSEDVLGPARWV